MRGKNKTTMKISPEAVEEYKKITAARYYNGLDKKQLYPGDLAEKVLNIPNVRKILMESTIKDDK